MQKELEEMIIDKELEEMIIDKELFMKIYKLFTHMSKRGKDATVQTLLSFLIEEV